MIEYVTIDQAAELDAFVLRQPNCHFMQTSVWGRVKEGWGWTGILCRDEKGEIIGSMAILEHRIRHMHTGFLYAPRGPIFRDATTPHSRRLWTPCARWPRSAATI